MKSSRAVALWVLAGLFGAATFTASSLKGADAESPAKLKGWTKGRGWGWVWGKDDEVGALNAMTDASRAARSPWRRRAKPSISV